MVAYDDEGSSDSEHDAYRARMIAEGEEKDSEDGKTNLIPKPDLLLGSNPYMHSSHIISSNIIRTWLVSFLQKTQILWQETAAVKTTWSK